MFNFKKIMRVVMLVLSCCLSWVSPIEIQKWSQVICQELCNLTYVFQVYQQKYLRFKSPSFNQWLRHLLLRVFKFKKVQKKIIIYYIYIYIQNPQIILNSLNWDLEHPVSPFSSFFFLFIFCFAQEPTV